MLTLFGRQNLTISIIHNTLNIEIQRNVHKYIAYSRYICNVHTYHIKHIFFSFKCLSLFLVYSLIMDWLYKCLTFNENFFIIKFQTIRDPNTMKCMGPRGIFLFMSVLNWTRNRRDVQHRRIIENKNVFENERTKHYRGPYRHGVFCSFLSKYWFTITKT